MHEAVNIREYAESDANELFGAVNESIAELYPWMPWATEAYSLSDAAHWIQLVQDARTAGTLFDFAIIDYQGRYVGGCGLNQINTSNRVANLGYWVRSSASGRAIAPAAVRLIATWAFENTSLNRLEIVAAVDNVRSRRVAEKAGAHFDAVLKQRLIVDERASDAALYSFVRAT